ncbi:MAG: CDP-glycerol glycerophosphotransferase family protein [Acutalibacteraceae bacterium]
MQIKDDCLNAKIEITEAYTQDEKLTLSAYLVCDYSPLVRSPRLTISFESGGKTRILPFFITAYFPHEDLKKCTIMASYVFDIENLFLEYTQGEIINMHFDLEYGDSYVQGVKLSYSADTQLGDGVYKIWECDENTCIKLQKKLEFFEFEKPDTFLNYIERFFFVLYNGILRVFGYLCIPFFFIDAIMARMELTRCEKRIANRSGLRFYADHVRLRFIAVTKQGIGRGRFKNNLLNFALKWYSKSEVKSNRVTFLSNRRDDLSGNFEYIYDILKNDETLDIQMLLDTEPAHRMSNKNIIKFAKLYSTSSVVIIDDFYELTSFAQKKQGVKLIQVWHACGAFKTFGFSRLGKPGGPCQTSLHHRDYDYAVVSSENIRRFYAEGFGIPLDNVVATGVPRTDIFFDDKYKEEKRKEFFEKYPKLKDKKIMLFAPTFRGNGKLTGSYPVKRFDLKTVYEKTNGEYAIIVKLHPFIKDSFTIPKQYKDYILDFSLHSELNDLLFVTDLLVSDYSSAIFEASLLNIPMLFYAFDLNEYISSRDFYCEYKSFLPGKITYDLQGLLQAVNDKDFEVEKINAFRDKFFDEQDGGSSKRVANLVNRIIKDDE